MGHEVGGAKPAVFLVVARNHALLLPRCIQLDENPTNICESARSIPLQAIGKNGSPRSHQSIQRTRTS